MAEGANRYRMDSTLTTSSQKRAGTMSACRARITSRRCCRTSSLPGSSTISFRAADASTTRGISGRSVAVLPLLPDQGGGVGKIPQVWVLGRHPPREGLQPVQRRKGALSRLLRRVLELQPVLIGHQDGQRPVVALDDDAFTG